MTNLTLIERPDGTVVNDTGNDPGATRLTGHRQYFVGVDLAQQMDFTAIVALFSEQVPIIRDERVVLSERTLTVTYADRFRGVSYPNIVSHLAKIMVAKPFAGRCKLSMDSTGLGRPVSDLMVEANIPHDAITMTVGQNWSRKGRYISVGKTLLVENLSVLFQAGTLTFAKDLPLRQEIEQDLASFSLTETAAGNQIITQSRQSGSHGDCAIALACACFSATHVNTGITGQGQLTGWY